MFFIVFMLLPQIKNIFRRQCEKLSESVQSETSASDEGAVTNSNNTK